MNTMRIAVFIELLLWAMLQANASAQPGPFARMNVLGHPGDQAYVEQRQVEPLAKDVPLQDGNMVRTGEETLALVIMPESEVLLDQNSAKLISYSFLKGTRCYTSHLREGRMLIAGKDICFMADDRPLGFYSQSLINVRYTETGDVEVTVIKGKAIVVQPTKMEVKKREQLIVHPDGTYYKTKLSTTEAKETARWAEEYVQSMSSSGGSSAAGGIIAGVFGAFVLCRMVGECGGGDHEPSPQPPQEPESPKPRDGCAVDDTPGCQPPTP